MQVRGACAELLLILPDDGLGGIGIVVRICPRHGRGFSLMPSVHQSHHDAELCIGGQVAEIGAVVAVLGRIAVARGIADARFHAVDLM